MTPDEYLAHDAVGLAALVSDGEVTADELRDAAGARHSQTHAAINAVVEWYDNPEPPNLVGDPVLGGVPFLRKDFGAAEAGRLLEMGSRLAQGNRATTTSPYFERMRAAGVQVLGRTTVPEFAQHGTTESVACGPTRNPLNTSTSSGGSSGGAAAAVRSGVIPLAHASDAAGSIRIPSAVTGLIGLKPTRDLMPTPADNWRGLVTEFVVARSVADVEASLRVLAATDSSPGFGGRSPKTGPWRIALSLDHWAGFATDPVVTGAVETAARTLESQGHTIEPITCPFNYEQLMSTWPALFNGGIADVAAQVSTATGRPLDAEHLEPMTLHLLAEAHGLDPSALQEAQEARATVTVELAANLEGFDLLLTPTLDRLTIPLERMAGFTPVADYMADGDEWFDRLYLANVSGWPAISIPAVAASPPVGLQFMAAPGREADLVGVTRSLMGDTIVPAVMPTAGPANETGVGL